ncbi:MAG TPA: hypothetical protein DCE08_02615 [Ruminococcaceae bacterium]|nr:hypothetical protein [Oscillospiraceae bacterium]
MPLKRRKTAAFCYFSVPQAPSVTLARDTFLPEEGSWRRAALPQKKSVQTFGFKALDFHFYFRFFRNLNTPQSPAATAPLLKRGQPTGVRLRCRTKKSRIAVRRIFALIHEKIGAKSLRAAPSARERRGNFLLLQSGQKLLHR